MNVTEIKRHCDALRARQFALKQMADELAIINAQHQEALQKHYERKSTILRNLAFYGVPTSVLEANSQGGHG